MPVYEVSSPDGRRFRVEGDEPPAESDLDEIFKSAPEAKSAADDLVAPRFKSPIDLPPVTESDIAETRSMGSPARNAAKGLNLLGKSAVGAAADLGSVAFRPLTDELYPEQATEGPVDPENLKAIARNEPLPAEDLRSLPKFAQIVGRGAQGLIETTPRLAAVAGLQAVGVPAPVAAGAIFGSTEEGFDPKQAAVAAALPFVGKYSGAMTEALVAKLGVTKDVVLAIFNKLGGATGAAALLKGVDEAEISKLPPEQRDQARINSWAGIAGQAALGMIGEREPKNAPEPFRADEMAGVRPAPESVPVVEAKAQEPTPEVTPAAAPEVTPEPGTKPVPSVTNPVPETKGEPTGAIPQAPEPERFDTVDDLLKFRQTRLAEERDLYKNQIGLSDEQAAKLQRLFARDADTEKFEQSLTPEQLKRYNQLFDGPLNSKEGPQAFKFWDTDTRLNPEDVAGETDPKLLSSALVTAVQRGVEESASSDRFLSAAIAARRLKELGFTKSDVARYLDEYTTRNSSSQGDKVEFFKSLGKKVNTFLARQGIELPEGNLARTKLDAPEQPTVAEPQSAAAVEADPGISVGPGAASPGDIPAESQLSQLSSAIEGKISPDQPIADRIQSAVDLGKQWASDKKDSFLSSVASTRAASSALLDGYLHLPKWTDFTKAVGEWTGADQKTALEVRKFLKAIQKAVPEKIRQEAITNWIQADGDEALLRSRADASKPALKKAYEVALKLNESEKTLARNIQSYFESRLDEGIKAGILKAGVKDYVNQIWKRENSVTQKLWADLFGIGTLNPNFKFAKQRIFESYFDGEQAGFDPKNKTIGHLIGAYDLAFNRALSARALIKQLHDGKAADGAPISMTSGKTTPLPPGDEPPEAFLIKPNAAPEGAVTPDGRPYRPIDHWALRDWKWATKGPDGQNVFVQGDMLVHPDHYRHLNSVLKSSQLASPEGVTGLTTRPLLKLGAFAKQTKLSLSPFHAVQEGVHALAHRVNPLNLPEINLDEPGQKSLVNHGLMVQDPRASELFAEGMTGGGLVTKIPGLGQMQTAFNDILFKDYIPRLKMAMAYDALERNMKVYAKDIASGKVTEDQIVALTAREANAAFGEQNYKMMGRSQTLQDFFRLTLLAPDFLEARFRFVGQALKPYGAEQRVALALMGGIMYVGGRILNKALDDDYHWNKPFSVFNKGTEYRLRTLLGDVQHLITDPRSFWYNRMSAITRSLTEYVTGRDDRGIKRSSLEQLKDLASWFVPIPLQKRSDQTTAQAVLSSAGIPSKPYGAQQELYEKLDSWRSKQADPKIKEQYDAYRQETHKDSIYRPVRDAIRKDSQKDFESAYAELLKLKKPTDIDKAIRPFTVHQISGTDYWGKSDKPFTGSRKTEKPFVQSLDDEGKKLYDRAKQERADQYQKFKEMLKRRPKG